MTIYQYNTRIKIELQIFIMAKTPKPKKPLNTTSVRIRTDLKKAIQVYASKEKLTMTKVMVTIFENFIAEHNLPYEKTK